MAAIAARPGEDAGDSVGALVELEAFGDVLAAKAFSRRVDQQVKELARRWREPPIEPGGLVGVLCRPGTSLGVMAHAARAAASAAAVRGCGPGLGCQEGREPRVELGYAVLWDGDG